MKKRSLKILSVFLMLTIFVSMLNVHAFAATSLTLDKPTLKVAAYLMPKFRLTWNSVKGANLYYIYRLEGEGKSLKYIAETSNTTYDDKNIKYDTNYTYAVRAYTSKNGTLTAKSGVSNMVKSLVPNIQKVSNVTATTVSDSKIKVSWNKVSTAERYYLYYGEAGGNYKCLGYLKGTSTSYTFTGLKANTKYYFKVKATRVINGTTYNAGYSADVSATTSKSATSTATNEYTVDFKKISTKDAGMPSGAAICCLAMVLNHNGANTTPKELLSYLKCSEEFYTKDGVLYGPDAGTYFIGNPYSEKAYAYSIKIWPLIDAAEYYIKDKKLNIEPSYDIDIYNFDTIKNYIKRGNIFVARVVDGDDKRTLEWRSYRGKSRYNEIFNYDEKYVVVFGVTDTDMITYDPATGKVKNYKYVYGATIADLAGYNKK